MIVPIDLVQKEKRQLMQVSLIQQMGVECRLWYDCDGMGGCGCLRAGAEQAQTQKKKETRKIIASPQTATADA